MNVNVCQWVLPSTAQQLLTDAFGIQQPVSSTEDPGSGFVVPSAFRPMIFRVSGGRFPSLITVSLITDDWP
jgi:hypothetical protein